MSRDIPIGNGRLFAAFDRTYALRDLTWPHVGQENHAHGRRSRIAIHAGGRTTWVGDRDWRLDLRYEPDTLVTDVRARHEDLGLEIRASDAVDPERPVLARRLVVRNLHDHARAVRLILHHDFDLGESDSGITSYFDAPLQALIHYRRHRWVLVNLCRAGGRAGVRSYACDHRVARGGRGVAGLVEDEGALNGNPIALGAVDAAVATDLSVPAAGEAEVFAWLALGSRYQDVAAEDAWVRDAGPAAVLARARAHWAAYARDGVAGDAGSPEEVAAARRSLLLTRVHADAGGAIVAAIDSDTLDPGRETYAYVWPRDGAFAADALSRAGDVETARRFFLFAHQHLAAGGWFLHRYHPDGSLGSSWLPWVRDGREVLPVQEDETALVLWALDRHVGRHGDHAFARGLMPRLVHGAAEWLCRHRNPETGLPLPSWDLWEERFGVHTFTVASVIAGLRAASALAAGLGDAGAAARWSDTAAAIDAAMDRYLWHESEGRFARTGYPEGQGYWLDTAADASLAGLFLLGVRPAADPRVAATLEAVRERLAVRTPVGGLARYEGDPFCRPEPDLARAPGNPWFVTSFWLAEWDLARAEDPVALEAAAQPLRWARERALPSGVLPEQLHPASGEPRSVSPLAWSHAAFLSAALTLAGRRRGIHIARGPA